MTKNLSLLMCAILCTSFLQASDQPKSRHVTFKDYDSQVPKQEMPKQQPKEITLKLPPTSTTEPSKTAQNLSKIILVVKAISNAVKSLNLQTEDNKKHEIDNFIRKLLSYLDNEYPNLADTKELTPARMAINAATEELIRSFNIHMKDNVKLEFKEQKQLDAFAQKFIQPCYEALLQNPSIMATLLPTTAANKVGSYLFNVKPELLKTEVLRVTTRNLLYRIGHIWQITLALFNIDENKKITLTKPAVELSIQEWFLENSNAANRIITEAKTPADAKTSAAQGLIPAAAQTTEIKPVKIVPPSAEKLKIVEALKNNLTMYFNEHLLTHELFTKNKKQFAHFIAGSYKFLTLIDIIFQEKSPLQADQRIMLARNGFITTMNELYAILFKSKFGGHIGAKFLVVKHKFKPKYRNSGSTTGIIRTTPAYPEDSLPLEIPPLPADQAVIALTELVMLWEIYQNLFENTDKNTEDFNLITLPYFKESYSASDWMYYTTHAGFTKKAEFSEALQASLKPLLPESKKLSQALKDSFTSLTSTIQEGAEATKSWAESQGVALVEKLIQFKKYVARKTEKLTENIEDIPDEL